MSLFFTFFLEGFSSFFKNSSFAALFCLSGEYVKKPYSFLSLCLIYGCIYDLFYTTQFGFHGFLTLWVGSFLLWFQKRFSSSIFSFVFFLLSYSILFHSFSSFFWNFFFFFLFRIK